MVCPVSPYCIVLGNIMCKHFIKYESQHFLFPIYKREKHWTYQLLPINVLACDSTKQVFKYVLHWKIIIDFLHFNELWPCVYIKLKKYVTSPWISWNLVTIFLTYMDSLYVEMVSWQIQQHVKILIPNLTEYKIYSWKLGNHLIKMNAGPPS